MSLEKNLAEVNEEQSWINQEGDCWELSNFDKWSHIYSSWAKYFAKRREISIKLRN